MHDWNYTNDTRALILLKAQWVLFSIELDNSNYVACVYPFFNMSHIWYIFSHSLFRPCAAVYTLARVFGVEGELSGIARQGSGSACRSMYGGFVQWIMGQKDDGKDSLAQQVEPETHWPELRILVLVVGQFVCVWERETESDKMRLKEWCESVMSWNICALLWKSHT